MKAKKSEFIQEESDHNGLFLGLVLITAAISAGIAILYAPKSGKEVRDQIKDLADKQKDNLTDQINRGKEKATGVVDTVKNKYSEVAEQAKSKLESFTHKEGTTEPTDLKPERLLIIRHSMPLAESDNHHFKSCNRMAQQEFTECIDACVACAMACSYCATACLKEEQVEHMAKCIQLDLECAAICRSAAEVMSLGSSFSAHLCRICADACKACAAECEKHAEMGMDHCRACAEACHNCARVCEGMATPV